MLFDKKVHYNVAQFKKMSYTCTGFLTTNLNKEFNRYGSNN